MATLYDHKNSVNSIAVSDDQTFFLTSSKEEKAIYLHLMKNIKEDIKTESRPLIVT